MRAALAFLTRLPVHMPDSDDWAAAVGRDVPFFPVVGLVIGLCALVADWAVGLFFGPAVRSAAAVTASVAATGALHLDGLMDTADGVLSSRSRERMLEIMRDSRVGAMGVVAGTLSLLLRFALLLEMAPSLRWRALLTAPVLGRTAMVLAMAGWPSARGRAQGMGGSIAAAAGPWHVAGALAVGLVLSLLLGGWWRGAAAWPAALLAGALTARRLSARLGGLTGDTYGAINEVAEIVVLALYAASWRGGA